MPAWFATTINCNGHLEFWGGSAFIRAAGELHGMSNEKAPAGIRHEALTVGWRSHEAQEDRGQLGSNMTVKVGAAEWLQEAIAHRRDLRMDPEMNGGCTIEGPVHSSE